MSGGGDSTQATTVRLPPFAEDALRFGKDRAMDLYDRGVPPPFYPGAITAPTGPLFNEAIAGYSGLSRAGGPAAVGSALEQADATARGDYLTGPGMEAAQDAAFRRIAPQIQSQFTGAGRYGSGLADAAVAREVGDAYAGLYGDERNRMMQVGQQLPLLETAGYMPYDRMFQADERARQARQRDLDVARTRYEYDVQLPYQRVDDFIRRAAAVQPGSGFGTTLTPGSSNPFASALGGAASGAGIASALNVSNPVGWGLAGTGALLGLLG